jgi:hypothetical protein
MAGLQVVADIGVVLPDVLAILIPVPPAGRRAAVGDNPLLANMAVAARARMVVRVNMDTSCELVHTSVGPMIGAIRSRRRAALPGDSSNP